MIGYIKFLSLKYCKEEEKEIIFKDCHTWLSQALSNNAYSNPIQLAKIYYMEMLFFLKTGDKLSAKDMYNNFSDMMKKCTPEANPYILESPHFWFEKAQMVYDNEILKNSTTLLN